MNEPMAEARSLTSLVEDEVDSVLDRLQAAGITVLEGNKVVNRTGAQVSLAPLLALD